MLVTATSVAAAPPSATMDGGQAVPSPQQAASTDPGDSITLSAQAQQLLSGQATPGGEALRQAADLLNDTTGKVAVADQLGAFALITSFVANGANFDAPKDLTTTIVAGAALYDSAFAKHQQQLLDAVNSRMVSSHDTATSASLQDALSVFNKFSARDQEIYLGAINLQAQTAPGASASGPAFASVDSYRANLQAQADIHSAVEAAQAKPADGSDPSIPPLMALYGGSPQSDAWTQKAQAFFAQFGPAPPSDPKTDHFWTPSGAAPPAGTALMGALAVVNDSSGSMSVKDQLAAYDLLSTYSASSTDKGPARDAVIQSFEASPFAHHLAQVQTLMNSPIFASDVGAELLDRLGRLTSDDQQVAFHVESKNGSFASLDSLKANDLARSAIQKVIAKIFAKFGGDDLTKLTDPRLVRSPAFKALLNLVRQNPASDGWTAQATEVLEGLAKLDLSPDDPKAKERAQALATLQAPPPVNAGQAIAMKTLKHISDDLQKARDDRAAAAAGQPPKAGKPTKAEADDKTNPSAAQKAAPAYAPGEEVDTYA